MNRVIVTDSEALKAVREASISIACLTDFYEYFEDESVTKNHKKWVLKEEELLKRDIYHIQNIITILENYIDPIPEEDLHETKLTKQEYDSFRSKWIKDTVYYMDRDQLENYAMLYFQQDLKNEDQEDAFESMQSIDNEVFTTLANEFNLEVN
tara:strand:- start:45 stop:503 length:459 start_codon:yes stop_codon:yes gene_type:complete